MLGLRENDGLSRCLTLVCIQSLEPLECQRNEKRKGIGGVECADSKAALKSESKITYGPGTANQFSADQGCSEHQLGTSVDFTTLDAGAVFSKFRTDPAYQWLKDNAHNYGFILSYPEENSYYKFEPWHWRFVGVELAKTLHRENKYFYDLDQREIDTYLIKLFDW